ncbi:MAG: DUF2309 domain-containing protein [Acidimicrobiales bacterium]|nr:DUF2309 domain-containing protein [Acidimicrobiales bacterium]
MSVEETVTGIAVTTDDATSQLDTTVEARARLRVEIAESSRIVAPVWPLERFVAVNPLLGLLEEGFDGAVSDARRWLGARGYPGVPAPSQRVGTVLATAAPDVAEAVAGLVARWCALLVDPHGTMAGAASRYEAWRQVARHDRSLRRLVGGDLAASVAALPDRADDAVLTALDRLGIEPEGRTHELRAQLARLPGWAGYARWCDEWSGPQDPTPRLHLVELLAIALSTDAMVAGAAGVDASTGAAGIEPATTDDVDEPACAAAREGLAAAEGAYRDHLLAALAGPGRHGPVTPAAQVVCCIDVRSELLRRHLEAVGPYDTLGFAGFFATPVRIRPLGSAESYPSAPVLLDPEVEVRERPDPDHPESAAGVVRSRARRAAGVAAVEDLGHDAVAMYALAETAGWVFGPAALARTVAPSPRRGRDAAAVTVVDPAEVLGLDERATVAETALRTMGLTEGFAPVVLLCGHGATTAANAHAASLDCGACGGNHGGPNARTLAAILNDEEVRAELRARGVTIGEGTWFGAAEHDTTTDEVALLDAHRAPASHRDAVDRLAADLAIAGERAAAERMTRLPGGLGRDRKAGTATAKRAARRARRRAGDWAQTRPEWGLARNAAFVVGPRDLTRGVDLAGRTFLHSYDAAADTAGVALETILTAPMVVAHWINAQYYFSTVDPEVFGAGDKALHNPVAGVGVLSGADGDLQVGLPWQSVAGPDGPYHEPLRLLTVVEAPLERIDAVIARNPILQHLFGGRWVHLVARSDPDQPWTQWADAGVWHAAHVSRTECFT